jgi:hypothetical protein
MLYEVLTPIKDYIVADTFKDAVKQYIKKHEIKIRNIDNIEITDQIKTEIFHTQYSSKKKNFKIIRISKTERVLPEKTMEYEPSYIVMPQITASNIPINSTINVIKPLPLDPVIPPKASPMPSPMPAGEIDYLITKVDIDNLVNPKNVLNNNYFTNKILPKIQNFEGTIEKNHYINPKDFTYIYATSDIHADYRKFVQILISSGLIDCPINPYDDIYNPRIIVESTWTKKNTLFVILGDLVDGQRPGGDEYSYGDVTDSVGSFELLLHMLIYNLRIKARKMGSDILFTIGNHDYETVINGKNEKKYDDSYIYNYIHNNVSNFFSSSDNWIDLRCDILIPFYNLSPYLYLYIQEDDIVFAHAGLNISSNIQPIKLFQLNGLQTIINNSGFNSLSLDINRSLRQIFYTRIYGDYGVNDDGSIDNNKRKDLCNTITDANINLLIVGHCPSILYGINRRIRLDKLSNSTYKNCDTGYYGNDKEETKGCLFKDCEDNDGNPRLIFVDTGSSLAFRNDDWVPDVDTQINNINNNKLRGVEILKLIHSDKVKSKRHFNIMQRFVLFEKTQENINILGN